jgi:NTF2-related export protein 1/2
MIRGQMLYLVYPYTVKLVKQHHGHKLESESLSKRVRFRHSTVVSISHSFWYRSIEIATRAADRFTRLYYDAYDSSTRDVDVPKFYRPTSSLTWNGKPYQGSDGVRTLIENMPKTKHDVQCLDCHPIPGLHSSPAVPSSTYSTSLTLGSQPPSLLVTVSGNVVHGPGPVGNPPATAARSVDGQPRVFSQTFVLVPDPTAPPTKTGEVAKYYVHADAMRFVG